MSKKSERKKQAKKEKQAAAVQRARQQVTQNPHDDQYYVHFGVVQRDGQDAIVCMGIPGEGDYWKKHAEFVSTLKEVAPKIRDGSAYANMFKLYEDGRACPAFGFGTDASSRKDADEVTDYFKEHLEAHHYDQNFPEHAADMKRLVDAVVRTVSARTSLPVQVPEGAEINPEFLTAMIREYLENAKMQITKTGKAKGCIGWGTNDGPFVYNGGVIHPKYRFGRAVSEVAAIINAPIIVQGGEGWIRDPKTYKRTGDEFVNMQIVAPDATVVANGSIKFRRIDCTLKFDDSDIRVFDDKRHKQFLFPKWAYFPTRATAAA